MRSSTRILTAAAASLAVAACAPSSAPTSDGSSSSRVVIDLSSEGSSSVAAMEASSASAAAAMQPASSRGAASSGTAASLRVNASAGANASVAIPVAGAVRTVAVQVSDWAFAPAVITAKKGEKLALALTGMSGIHGYAVPRLKINARVEAGKTVTVDVPTDTTGTFDVFCSIPCGPGHRDMKAQIIIQ